MPRCWLSSGSQFTEQSKLLPAIERRIQQRRTWHFTPPLQEGGNVILSPSLPPAGTGRCKFSCSTLLYALWLLCTAVRQSTIGQSQAGFRNPFHVRSMNFPMKESASAIRLLISHALCPRLPWSLLNPPSPKLLNQRIQTRGIARIGSLERYYSATGFEPPPPNRSLYHHNRPLVLRFWQMWVFQPQPNGPTTP